MGGRRGAGQGRDRGGRRRAAGTIHRIIVLKRVIPLNSAARKATLGSEPVKAELWGRIYKRVGAYWKGPGACHPADGGRGGHPAHAGGHHETAARRGLFRRQAALCLVLAAGGGGTDLCARGLQFLQRLPAGLGGQQRVAGHAPRHVRTSAGAARRRLQDRRHRPPAEPLHHRRRQRHRLRHRCDFRAGARNPGRDRASSACCCTCPGC